MSPFHDGALTDAQTKQTYRVRVSYSDNQTREFAVGADQTILDAAEFAGAPIVNACQAGICGTCVARRRSGQVSVDVSIGLSCAEKESGRLLTCQAFPQSDCDIEVDYPLGANSAYVIAGETIVRQVKFLSESVALLELDASSLPEQMSWEPGQFAQLRVPGKESWRSYSFASAQSNNGGVEFLIRLVENGEMSAYLQRECRPGDRIDIRGPKGGFSLRAENRPVVLIAGGTGLSSILAIAERLVETQHPHSIQIFYGAGKAADLVLLDRLDELARRHPSLTWRGCAMDTAGDASLKRGPVTALLRAEAFNGGDVDIYLCGPSPMIAATRSWLQTNGVTTANVYFEAFAPSGQKPGKATIAEMSVSPDKARLKVEGRSVAVVAGGSIAGIAAAKMLSEKYDRVIILEKDSIHRRMEGRQGAAQGWHLHHLLIAGQQALDSVFPGIIDDMERAGAFKVDMGEQYRVYIAGEWKKVQKSGIEIVCAGRPLLEWCIRRRLDAEPRIDYRYDSELLDLVFDDASGAVQGVVARCGGNVEVIACELLIDASGKNTPLPALLEKHGFDKPALESDDIACFYSTMHHRVPADRAWRDHVMTVCYPYRPQQRHYAAQYFTDSSRSVLSTTLVGYDCYDPPRNAQEFREFARRMPVQNFGDELDGLEPISPVYNFRYPTMQRFLYWDAADHPGGVIAIGDALASADPVSGAGMTKAFLEIVALRKLMHCADLQQPTAVRSFYREIRSLSDIVWSVIREQTMRYPWIKDAKKKRGRLAPVQNWYVDRLMEAMHQNPELYRTFLSVTHFVEPPEALMRPRVAAEVLGRWLRTRLQFKASLIDRKFGAASKPDERQFLDPRRVGAE